VILAAETTSHPGGIRSDDRARSQEQHPDQWSSPSRRDQGRNALRLRVEANGLSLLILMTSFAFIFGVMPAGVATARGRSCGRAGTRCVRRHDRSSDGVRPHLHAHLLRGPAAAIAKGSPTPSAPEAQPAPGGMGAPVPQDQFGYRRGAQRKETTLSAARRPPTSQTIPPTARSSGGLRSPHAHARLCITDAAKRRSDWGGRAGYSPQATPRHRRGLPRQGRLPDTRDHRSALRIPGAARRCGHVGATVAFVWRRRWTKSAKQEEGRSDRVGSALPAWSGRVRLAPARAAGWQGRRSTSAAILV